MMMTSTARLRADQLLVRSGLARSRTEAQQLIESRQVVVRDGSGRHLAVKPSTRILPGSQFELRGEPIRFASRGALKLQGALDGFSISVRGLTCLDAGQSSGGFTDCLLANEARAVVGIDVGHGQLVERLRSDPRVLCVERFNLRDADRPSVAQQLSRTDSQMPQNGRQRIISELLTEGFNLVVADLSFISIRKVMPALATLLGAGRQMILLVKPQFELGPGAVNRRGIVRNPNAAQQLESEIKVAAQSLDFSLKGWISSPVTGGDGNQEYLALLESS